MPESVKKMLFANGLTVLLKEIHTAPIISQWVWYRVGARNEAHGKTGVSHWVEHMQFKGTAQFPAGVLDKAISRNGGTWNAFTYLDWTAYFETLPADKIDLGLRLEADRMVNSLFEPAEVDSERTVIISELEGNQNEPMFRLDVAVQEAAFTSHPYRNEVIGELVDLQHMQRDDLYQHYQRYYNPANALVGIAGDFQTNEMLQRLEDLYGEISGNPVPALSLALEPPQAAEKRVEVSGPGETVYLRTACRAPSASDVDFFAFTVLDSLLSGPSSFNMFGGGGISNKTSRLYRALVEKELAVSVNGGLQATIDPYLYNITAVVRPDRSPQDLLEKLDDEIKRIQDEPVSPGEIQRAIKQARAMFAYGSENITNQGFWLGYAEMFDHYQWFECYMDQLEKVTAADVQRIAQTYLNPARRVVGVYLPNGEEVEEETE